jgi:hypothetical protein
VRPISGRSDPGNLVFRNDPLRDTDESMSYTGQNHTLTSALEQGPLQPLGIEIKADGSPRADGAIEKSTLFFRDAKCRYWPISAAPVA